MREAHAARTLDEGARDSLPATAVRAKHVSRLEAARLGIQSDVLAAYRETNETPGSDNVERMTDDAETERSPSGRGGSSARRGTTSQTRKRAGTSTVGGAELPHQKRVAKP